MDKIITFTPKELMECIVLIWACISAIIGMIGLIINRINKHKKPNEIQNKRLDAIEERLKKFDEMFMNDNNRMGYIEDSNSVILRSLLALLSHGIDGNNVDDMRKAKKELEEYLIKR